MLYMNLEESVHRLSTKSLYSDISYTLPEPDISYTLPEPEPDISYTLPEPEAVS